MTLFFFILSEILVMENITSYCHFFSCESGNWNQRILYLWCFQSSIRRMTQYFGNLLLFPRQCWIENRLNCRPNLKFFNFGKVSNKNTWYMLIMLVVQLSLKKSAKIVMLVFSQLSKKYAGLVELERASIISFLLNSYWVCRSTRDCIEKTTSFNVTSVIERTCWCSGWKRYWPNSVQSNWNQSRSCKVLGNSSDSVRDAHNTLAHFSDFYTLFF